MDSQASDNRPAAPECLRALDNLAALAADRVTALRLATNTMPLNHGNLPLLAEYREWVRLSMDLICAAAAVRGAVGGVK